MCADENRDRYDPNCRNGSSDLTKAVKSLPKLSPIWRAALRVDTIRQVFDRLPGVLILELHRAEIAEFGMKTLAVVNLVDEPWKIRCHLLERLLGRQVDGFDLERLNKAFRFGVTVWVAATAH